MINLKLFSQLPRGIVNKVVRNSQFAKFTKSNFSSYDLDIPTINLDKFMNKSQGWEQECKIAADCLHDTGILVVRDTVIYIKMTYN
jgi:hypothetical protein